MISTVQPVMPANVSHINPDLSKKVSSISKPNNNDTSEKKDVSATDLSSKISDVSHAKQVGETQVNEDTFTTSKKENGLEAESETQPEPKKKTPWGKIAGIVGGITALGVLGYFVFKGDGEQVIKETEKDVEKAGKKLENEAKHEHAHGEEHGHGDKKIENTKCNSTDPEHVHGPECGH